jgi:uncharacterized protein with ParB-like and HNH nuclease domain
MKKEDSDKLLKDFMEDRFDYASLKKAGFYGKHIKRNDYKAQAAKVCEFFGYKTVYEYGAKELQAHLTYAEGERPLYVNREGQLCEEPFVTVIKSIYE